MSWQDELRRLDEELATGRISADDYRSRRDAVMASAVSPTAQPAPSESTTVMPQIPTGQQATAQPGDPDKTQIVSGRSADSDRTQAVGGGWVATPPPDDPNRTQIVPGVPPQAYAGGRGLRPAPGFDQNQPPWQGEEPLPPSWSGQDFPPLAASNAPDWTLQGPEVFESEKKSGAGKVFGIIAIVVVLLGVAAGAYFLFRPDSNQQAGPGGNDSSTGETTTTTSAKPKGPIVELPGDQQNMASVKTFAQLKTIDYLTQQEIALYEQGGAGDAAVAISTDKDVRIIVVVVTMQSPEAAVTARDALGALQLNFNLVVRQSEPGVVASANPNASNGPLLRAHYASGGKVVRIQAQGKDGEAADKLFDQVISDQLERLPADG
jgi:hypothetical protein